MNELQSFKKSFERYISTYIQELNTTPLLREAMGYSLLDGGKRLRPLLAYAAAQLSSGNEETVLPIAVAVEMIHCYSLVHDDLPAMDDDDLRRGKLSNHKKYDEATAILVGDALLTEAFVVLTRAGLYNADKCVQLVAILSSAAGAKGMIKGQFLDMKAEDRYILSKELEEIHNHKTGAIIVASVLMGYLSGPVYSNKDFEVLGIFAKKLGLIFQIQDDILDATSSDEVLGKSVGKDVKQNKATYVTLLGLSKAQSYLKKLTHEAITILDDLGEKAYLLKKLTHYAMERKN